MSSNSISADDRGDDGSTITNKNSNDNLDDLQIASNKEELVLPPEVWASVMEYLPFDSVLCGATCRTILHDAMPLLTKLHINKSKQINLVVASRFRDIKEIHINSLYKLDLDDEGYTDVWIDMNTKIRLVSFLTRFVDLDRVVFWGRDDEGNCKSVADSFFFEGDEGYPNEGPRDSLKAFLDLVSGAFDCSALHKNLKISGLVCPDVSNTHGLRGNDCKTCMRACNSFPLQEVAEFECRGSSSSNGRAGRLFGLDVCLERATLESIIESRPGGRKLLRSKDRLLRLLGSGRRHEITSDDDEGRTLYIVKYTQTELNEIKRVIEYANLKVKRLDSTTVTEAIRSSFLGYGSSLPLENQCILSDESLQYVKDTIGLPVDIDVLERSLEDLMVHTQQIVSVLNQSDAEVNEDANEEVLNRYTDIHLDCLKLLHRFSEAENNPPIQQISNATTCLVNWLQNGVADEKKLGAAHILKNILAKGTDGDRKKIIDRGIPSFGRLLGSTNESLVMVALLALADIATNPGSDDVIKATSFTPELVSKLIGLLDSKHQDCVKSSLQILAAAKDHIPESDHLTLLTHLVKNMNMKEHEQSDELLNSSVLLRSIVEVENPGQVLFQAVKIQSVIDSGLVPTLIEILTTTENDAIQFNLEHVMVNLLAGTEKQLDVLVQNTGFLPKLVSIVEYQHGGLPEKAISELGKVAKLHRDMLLQAGIMMPLLRVLQTPNAALTILEATSSTLVACCRQGKLSNFAISKETLMVLTELLANDHKVVVHNTCWALFNVLFRLSRDEISEVISIGFIKPLLKLIPNAPHPVQEPVLKSIQLISSKGNAYVKAISLHDGISLLSKTLLSSTNEKNQKHTCYAIANIIRGSRDRNQSAIDNNIVPSLAKMLTLDTTKEGLKKAALSTLYEMTNAGSAAQIKYLFTEGCLNSLFDMLNIIDCSSTVLALQTLSCILKKGKEQSPNKARLLSSGIQDIEKKLRVLTDQNLRLHRNNERVELLSKKKAWLEVDQHLSTVESLTKAPDLLQEQLRDNDQRLQSIVQKIADVGEDSPLGQVYAKLKSKEEEARQFLSTQACATASEIFTANETLSQLKSKAEKVAPAKKWQERLARDDLPADLDVTNKELTELQSSVKSLNETRVVLSTERNKMKEGIEGLFDNVSIQTIMKKEEPKEKEEPKKRKVEELEDNGENKDDVPESKKKVQASLSTFFGGGKKKKAGPSEANGEEENDAVVDLTVDDSDSD